MMYELTIEQARAWLDQQDAFVCPEFRCLMPRRDCGERYRVARAKQRYWQKKHGTLATPDDSGERVEHVPVVLTLERCLNCAEGKRSAKRHSARPPRATRLTDNKANVVPPGGKIAFVPMSLAMGKAWVND